MNHMLSATMASKCICLCMLIEKLCSRCSRITGFVALTNSWCDRGGGNPTQSTLCLRARNGLEENLKNEGYGYRSL